jgi:glycosyltransferase involved in cell wall biosynthesis
MRILYLSADPGIPILGHKGASVHVREVVAAFGKLGCEVVVASPRAEAAENTLPREIPLVEIPAVRPRDCETEAEVRAQAERQAAAVVNLARMLGVHAIYERVSLASFAGARAARELGLPLVLEVNAPLRTEEVRFRHLRHPDFALEAEREELATALKVLAVSQPLAAWLEDEGVERERIELVPNAFPVSPLVREREVGAGTDLVVGFAGGLKLWHGIGVLVDGFRRALDAGGRLRLEVAGKGPAEDLLATAQLPPERFEWLGHLPHEEALARMTAWDVGVAPFTPVEGFWFSPLKLFEYMAAGLAVVASDVGDIPALLGGGDAGLLVPPGDPEALAAALLRLDRDRGLVSGLGARGAERARVGDSWIDNAALALAIFEGAQGAG